MNVRPNSSSWPLHTDSLLLGDGKHIPVCKHSERRKLCDIQLHKTVTQPSFLLSATVQAIERRIRQIIVLLFRQGDGHILPLIRCARCTPSVLDRQFFIGAKKKKENKLICVTIFQQ